MGLGNYAKRGWPGDDDYKQSTGGGGGGGGDGGGGMTPEERLYKFRFQIPTPEDNEITLKKPATKMVLVIDGVPCRVHEHELYHVRNKLRHQGNRYASLCLTKNSIDARGCPLCDDLDDWARFKGFFTIIDMGQVEFSEDGEFQIKGKTGRFNLHHRYWTNKEGEKQYVPFERVLLDAKAGSEDKPGVLRTLQMQAERRGGDLAGTVWHVTRTGKKTAKCGDDWDYLERIDMAEAAAYLRSFGANPKEMPEDWLKPVDYMAVLVPQSYEDMKYMIHGAAEGGNSGARSEGAGWSGQGGGSGSPDDDEIPF